jgi:hypothetical protein
MKSFAFAGLALVAAVAFTACDPKPKKQPEPAAGPSREPKPGGPNTPTLPPEDGVKPKDGQPDGGTKPGNVIPEPTPHRANPEYGIKIEGKSGYVKSPYDTQGRPIDVRGLPPGTEVEDPYTPGRTLLVP